MMILEQGVFNLEEGGEGNVQAVGMLNLVISTLLYERFGFIFVLFQINVFKFQHNLV